MFAGGAKSGGAGSDGAAAGSGFGGAEPRGSPWADRSCRFDGSGNGPLAGLTFGAKDIFEVGNPP